MKLHTLKIQPKYYYEVMSGSKTFEIRKNDRNFLAFDLIHFVNVNNEEFLNYENNVYQITYVLQNVPEYGLKEDYCILGIKKLTEGELNK